MRLLTVSAFSGASNLVLWVGEEQGLFHDEDVDLTLATPRGSVDQMRTFVDGRAPVLITAFDNVIAYRNGLGSDEIGYVLNGMPLNDIAYYTGYPNQFADTENLQRIELSQGSGDLDSPVINAAGGLMLTIPYAVVVPALALLAIVVGVAAGLYPALLLSRFPAAAMLASAWSLSSFSQRETLT